MVCGCVGKEEEVFQTHLTWVKYHLWRGTRFAVLLFNGSALKSRNFCQQPSQISSQKCKPWQIFSWLFQYLFLNTIFIMAS